MRWRGLALPGRAARRAWGGRSPGCPRSRRRATLAWPPTGHWYPPGAPVTQCPRRSGVSPGWPVFSGESSFTAAGQCCTRPCCGRFEDSLVIHRQSTGRPAFSPAPPGPSTGHPQPIHNPVTERHSVRPGPGRGRPAATGRGRVTSCRRRPTGRGRRRPRWRLRPPGRVRAPLGQPDHAGRQQPEASEEPAHLGVAARGDRLGQQPAERAGQVGPRRAASIAGRLGQHQEAARRYRVEQRGHDLAGAGVVRDELQDRIQHHGHRLGEIQLAGRFGHDLPGVPQVCLQVAGAAVRAAGQQRPRVAEHHRIAVHVADQRVRRDRLGHLVGAVRGREAGPDVEELPDPGLGREVAHRPDQECPGGPDRSGQAGEPGHRLVAGLPVHREVVPAAEPVVADPGDMGCARVEPGGRRAVAGRVTRHLGAVHRMCLSRCRLTGESRAAGGPPGCWRGLSAPAVRKAGASIFSAAGWPGRRSAGAGQLLLVAR